MIDSVVASLPSSTCQSGGVSKDRRLDRPSFLSLSCLFSFVAHQPVLVAHWTSLSSTPETPPIVLSVSHLSSLPAGKGDARWWDRAETAAV